MILIHSYLQKIIGCKIMLKCMTLYITQNLNFEKNLTNAYI